MINPWGALGTGRVRFARLRALIWAAVGLVSFPLGWANSVVLVWIASVYANVASEVAAGEASDDAAVINEIRALGRTRSARRPCRSARPASHGTRSSVRTRLSWGGGPRRDADPARRDGMHQGGTRDGRTARRAERAGRGDPRHR